MRKLLFTGMICLSAFSWSCSQSTSSIQQEPTTQEQSKSKTMNEEFIEQVLGFKSGPSHVDVNFELHAQNYRLNADDENFHEMMVTIIYSWKNRLPIKVTTEANKIIKAQQLPRK